jgi:hypothetical protein
MDEASGSSDGHGGRAKQERYGAGPDLYTRKSRNYGKGEEVCRWIGTWPGEGRRVVVGASW